MKKIINDKNVAVEQMLDGILYANDDILEGIKGTRVVLAKQRPKSGVAVISGGGSGHEPAHFGFVGDGMLAAAVCGEVFIPPTVSDILSAIKACDNGDGVFLIIKNFDVDVKNFLDAKVLAEKDGIKIAHVIVNDDCSVEKSNYKKRRRGVAGTILVQKIVCAAAKQGQSLEELEELASEVVMATNTLGVALSSPYIQGSTTPMFELGDHEISFGVGIHGEKGYRTEPLVSSELLALELVNKLKGRYELTSESSFAILVNGLGGTPLMELYIFMDDVKQLLEHEGIQVEFKKVGSLMTTNEMHGVSLTFLELKDPTWLSLLNSDVKTFAW